MCDPKDIYIYGVIYCEPKKKLQSVLPCCIAMRAAGHGAQCFASRGIHTHKSVKRLTDRAIRWLTEGGGASGASDRNGGHACRVHPSVGGGGGRGGGKEKGEGIKDKGTGGDGCHTGGQPLACR